MAVSTKKKGKKTVLELDINQSAPVVNWGEEMQNVKIDSTITYKTTTNLIFPSAPRAAYDKDDSSQIPDEPPYAIKVSNMPLNFVDDELIKFFDDLKIHDISRDRGKVYIEFGNKSDLMKALEKDRQKFEDRLIYVEYKERSVQQNRGFFDRGQDKYRRGSDYTLTMPHYSTQRNNNMGGGQGFRQPYRGSMSSDFHNRGNNNGGGPPSSFARYPGPVPASHLPPHPPPYANNQQGGGNYRNTNNANPNYNHRPAHYQDYNARGNRGASFQGNASGGPMPPLGEPAGFFANNNMAAPPHTAGFPATRNQNYNQGGQRDYQKAPPNRSRLGSETKDGAEPKHRTKLVLEPRTVTEDDTGKVVESEKYQSIFGGAKPVDTDKKEAEIEARLLAAKQEKLKQEGQQSLDVEKPPTRTNSSDDGERRISQASYSGSLAGDRMSRSTSLASFDPNNEEHIGGGGNPHRMNHRPSYGNADYEYETDVPLQAPPQPQPTKYGLTSSSPTSMTVSHSTNTGNYGNRYPQDRNRGGGPPSNQYGNYAGPPPRRYQGTRSVEGENNFHNSNNNRYHNNGQGRPGVQGHNNRPPNDTYPPMMKQGHDLDNGSGMPNYPPPNNNNHNQYNRTNVNNYPQQSAGGRNFQGVGTQNNNPTPPNEYYGNNRNNPNYVNRNNNRQSQSLAQNSQYNARRGSVPIQRYNNQGGQMNYQGQGNNRTMGPPPTSNMRRGPSHENASSGFRIAKPPLQQHGSYGGRNNSNNQYGNNGTNNNQYGGAGNMGSEKDTSFNICNTNKYLLLETEE